MADRTSGKSWYEHKIGPQHLFRFPAKWDERIQNARLLYFHENEDSWKRKKLQSFFFNCELSPLLWGPAVNPGSFPALWNLLISRENPISQNFARGCTKNRRKKTSNTKKPHRKKITCPKTVLRIFQRLCFARLTPTQKYWKKFN